MLLVSKEKCLEKMINLKYKTYRRGLSKNSLLDFSIKEENPSGPNVIVWSTLLLI